MISAWGSFAVQSRATLAGKPAAVHPQGGFAVEVQAAPGANHFPLVVTESNGTVTTKYVDLLVENSIPVIHRYDLNGNLESVAPQATPSSPTRTYQWDAVNRLVGITRILSPSDTRKTEFLYNGEGSRVGKKEFLNGVLQANVRYLYGDTGVLQERSADGGTVLKTYTAQGEQSYLTLNNQLSTTNLFFTRDHLGSVREVVAQNGTLLARYDYKPYGKRVQVSGTYEAAKGYTGHDYHAASDLILTRYRAYDANTARWLSPDPIEEAGGLNLYGYVGNEPLNFFDPTGEFALLPIIGIGVAIGVTVYGIIQAYTYGRGMLSNFGEGMSQRGRYLDNIKNSCPTDDGYSDILRGLQDAGGAASSVPGLSAAGSPPGIPVEPGTAAVSILDNIIKWFAGF